MFLLGMFIVLSAMGCLLLPDVRRNLSPLAQIIVVILVSLGIVLIVATTDADDVRMVLQPQTIDGGLQ